MVPPIFGVRPGVFAASQQERVVHGRPAAEAVAEEVARLGSRRVVLVASRSLAASPALREIEEALGPAHATTFTAVRPHAPREDVLEVARIAREAKADLLLAVGGGSVIDACKVALLCLRHALTEPAQLDAHAGRGWGDRSHRPADAEQWLRLVAVPTTFSAAEYTPFGGATEMASRRKQAFVHPLLVPRSVVLDPAMTLGTPLPVLLATGMKAVDHAVERLANPRPHPYSDAVSREALRLLAAALPRIADDPSHLAARDFAQHGVFLSMRGASAGVGTGLSHAIAHQLGSLAGVSHGDTSSLLLPAVMRWVAPVCRERQAIICSALGEPGDDASVPLAGLVARLGLPARLRDAGVDAKLLPEIARRTLEDPLVANCPRTVTSVEDVLEVLELAHA